MSQVTKPRIVFIFNPQGYEGFYVLGESESDRAQAMQVVSEVQDDMAVIDKKVIQTMGGTTA